MTRSRRYTTEELDTRLRFIGGIVLFAVFAFAMGTILYDLLFVEQPMTGMAPADKALVEILKMMVAFLAGVLTRVFDKSEPTRPMHFSMPHQAPCPPQPIAIKPKAPIIEEDDERAREAEARAAERGH